MHKNRVSRGRGRLVNSRSLAESGYQVESPVVRDRRAQRGARYRVGNLLQHHTAAVILCDNCGEKCRPPPNRMSRQRKVERWKEWDEECASEGDGENRDKEGVACSLFQCRKMKTKWVLLVAVLLAAQCLVMGRAGCVLWDADGPFPHWSSCMVRRQAGRQMWIMLSLGMIMYKCIPYKCFWRM